MTDPHDTVTKLDLSRPADAPPATFVLETIEGPDRGRALELNSTAPGRVLVGTSPACDLRLTDGLVSRRHCALEATAAGLRVTDLRSTNGTFVDRVQIVEALLQGDEVLRVGQTLFRVERGERAVAPVPAGSGFGRVLGVSLEMQRLYPLCVRLAATSVPVVIEGETGTGKEVLAESLHEQGPRAKEPFIIFDCTAVPAELIESELFGHERGAFTGAVSARRGVFEQAHHGTLFIDEIGDLPLELQPKLLRALERGEVRRVGSERWTKADVRVIAATRRDLDHEVQQGRFRDDLFHRLAVARIELPPLRQRVGDVELLARTFWAALRGAPSALEASVIGRWASEPWPGNVRELRNAVARHLALGDLQPAIVDRLERDGARLAGDSIERLLAMKLPFTVGRDRILEEFERRFVERLLAEHGGDVASAASASGIGRRYFQKLKARSAG